ncbi:hypothetical protein DRQ36_06785 [bacterium]|nr:MAG: hypothetical protein DRQ36_06785 [bacterium]
MKNLVLFLSLIILTGSCLALYLDSHTDPDSAHIGVGADANGLFSIGVPPNPPAYPDVRELLYSNYRDTSPGGAYIGFLINGTLYTVNSMLPFIYPDSAVDLQYHRIASTEQDIVNWWLKTEWLIDGDPHGNDDIRITQILQPQESGGSGTVAMKWIVYNGSSEIKDVGVLLYLDTKIASNDVPLIWGPGIPLSDTARILPDPGHGWDLPPFWVAYEYPPPDDTLGLVAKSVLSMPPNTEPDRIGFGQNGTILETFWEPTAWPALPYTDSAVLMWWFPDTLMPDSTRIVQTSYGLSDSAASIEGIYGMRLTFPRNLVVSNCNLLPNPFSLAVAVTNNDTAVNEIYATLDLAYASHCTLAAGETETKPVSPLNLSASGTGFVSWNIFINDLPVDDESDSIQVMAWTTDSFTITPLMPFTIEGSEYMGPDIELIEPLWLSPTAISSDTFQPIKIYLHDEDAGVDPERIFFYFIRLTDTTRVHIDDPRLTFENDTLIYTPMIPLENGTIYRFLLAEAEDYDGCPSMPDSGRFLSDLTGPTLGDYYPPDSSIQTDSMLVNWIHCQDALGSIRDSSILFWLTIDTEPSGVGIHGGAPDEGIRVGISSGVGNPDTIIWNPPDWTAGLSHIPDGYVTMDLRMVTDDPDYGIPNPSPDVPFSWWYIMNSHGPRAHPVLPDDGDYVSVGDTDIVFYLYDGNAMIPESTRVMFDGLVVTFDTDGPRDSLHTIPIDPSAAFPDGYTVALEVLNAYDSLLTPLDGTSHTEWSYTVDTSPPFISGGWPQGGETAGDDSIEIKIVIEDTYAGIDLDSIEVYVDGSLETLLEVAGDTVKFWRGDLEDSAIVRVKICDKIDVGPANWLDTSFVFYVVMEGPYAAFDRLDHGFICSASGPIKWTLTDPDTVVDSSIFVTVNSTEYTLDDVELEYDGTTLSFTPGSPWTDGFLISACLDSAVDIYGFALAAPVCGSWEVDLDRPEWAYAVDESIIVTGEASFDILDSLIHLYYYWGDGAMDSISLIINGADTFTVADIGLDYYDTLIYFDSYDAGVSLDSAVNYTFILNAKELCAFSDGEWTACTLEIFSTDIEETKIELPRNVVLYPNRPNPFNATTTIPFGVPASGYLTLEIVDLLGRKVCTVYEGHIDAGYREIIWDGFDDAGRESPSGVYNCRLVFGDRELTQRITLIR